MDVPAGVTQEEGNTGFSIHLLSAVLALIFLYGKKNPQHCVHNISVRIMEEPRDGFIPGPRFFHTPRFSEAIQSLT